MIVGPAHEVTSAEATEEFMVPASSTEMSGTESPNRKGPSNSNRSFSSLLPQNICNCCLLLPLVALIVVPSCALLVGLIAARLGRFGSMQSSSVFLAAKPFSSPSFRVKALLTNPITKTARDSGSMAASAPKWAQKSITLPPHRRGCHLITPKIVKEIGQDLSEFKCGLAHLFLHHTSASLTINENYDSDVRADTETFLNKIVPEGRSAPWKHTLEGPDDMPAHIKSSMFGCTLTIPITDGKLNMGTWQGIWLCEHRDVGTPRTVVITMNGI